MKKSTNITYKTQVQYDIEFDSLSNFTNVEHFDSDLFVVKISKNTAQTGFYESNQNEVNQCIISKEHLDALIATPENMKNHQKDFALKNPVILIKKEYLSYFCEVGNLSDELINLSKKQKMTDFNIKDVFDKSQGQDAMYVQYLTTDIYENVLKDNKGNIYIEPITLDYISARLDNEKYHLDELVEHLMKRNDIAFLTNSESRFTKQSLLKCPLSGEEKEVGNIIDDIPGYNCHGGREECLTIIYYPQQEDIKTILDWKKNENPEIYDYKLFIMSKIMNADQFLKNSVEPDKVPARKFKR